MCRFHEQHVNFLTEHKKKMSTLIRSDMSFCCVPLVPNKLSRPEETCKKNNKKQSILLHNHHSCNPEDQSNTVNIREDLTAVKDGCGLQWVLFQTRLGFSEGYDQFVSVCWPFSSRIACGGLESEKRVTCMTHSEGNMQPSLEAEPTR